MILDLEAEQAGDQLEIVFLKQNQKFYWKTAFHTIGVSHKIISAMEISRMIYMPRNLIIMLVKD